MRESVLGLIPSFLQCNLTLEQFWTYDFSELQLIFDNYANSVKEDMARTYNTASLIANFTNRLLVGEELPSLYEVYPNYFEKEEDTAGAEDIFKVWAEQWNSKHKEDENG